MYKEVSDIISEIEKVVIGKEDVIKKVLMSILARGHILLDDVPGVGKTTMAVAFGRVLGLDYNRIQFTPDVLPSDIVGFSIYNKEKDSFVYMPGTVNDTNLLLADEINRTSSRTQAALLEAMEEKQVTVDGKVHPLQDPFIVIATQNQVGTAGTQMLPHAQLDRFLVKLAIGYPDVASQMDIIKERQVIDPYAGLSSVITRDGLVKMQNYCLSMTMKDEIVSYIAELAIASREDPLIELGVSPRGAIAISHMAKACAFVDGRDYVTAEDVRNIFIDVCSHRILLSQKARMEGKDPSDVLTGLLEKVSMPFSG